MENKKNDKLNILCSKEAASILKVSDYTIESSIRRGELIGHIRYDNYYIFLDDLINFIKNGR